MRKSTINAKKVSKHTLRFRASTGPAIPMRSLASVGGPTRRAMNKQHRANMNGMQSVVMLPNWMQAGIAAYRRLAEIARANYEAIRG